jgi:hypothetical protein
MRSVPGAITHVQPQRNRVRRHPDATGVPALLKSKRLPFVSNRVVDRVLHVDGSGQNRCSHMTGERQIGVDFRARPPGNAAAYCVRWPSMRNRSGKAIQADAAVES